MNLARALRLTMAAVAALVLGYPQGASMSKHFKGADAALVQAVESDDRAAIARAIVAGGNVNARGGHRVTPLMIAVDRRKKNAVAELLARGADANLKADDGASAVSLAVENYRDVPDILFAVIRAGGSPDTLRPDNYPVIMRFVNDRNCEFIRHMKAVGANLDVTTRAGDPIVTSAALRGDWDVVWCLLELGARYDYEKTSRQPLSKSFFDNFPAPDSPIFPYKKKSWQFLKERGIAVPPLKD